MKIKKVTRGKGEWIIRIDKSMYRHLRLIPGYEYVWIFLEPDGSLRIRRVEDGEIIKKEEERRMSKNGEE